MLAPCGRFFHSAKAPFHQPPQRTKQACSLIPYHKSHAIALRVLADAYQRLFFVLEKDTKKCQRKLHLLNPLQASCYFVHSIQSHPCVNIFISNKHSAKETLFACGSFIHSTSISFWGSFLSYTLDPSLISAPFISATSATKARVLRTLA